MEKRYFKLLLDYGHLGNKNSLEVAHYIEAENCVDAFTAGNRMPGIKRKSEKTGTIRVVEISYNEYCTGQKTESIILYNTYRSRKCG